MSKLNPIRSIVVATMLAAFAFVGAAQTTPSTASAAAIAFTQTDQIPVSISTFVSCANGGSGENVTVSGNLNMIFHITTNANGGVAVSSQSNPQGISGTGTITGAKYQGTGVTRSSFTSNVGFTNTFVNNFRMIGQGPGNNFTVHQTFHVTVNANGTLTSTVDNTTVTCG